MYPVMLNTHLFIASYASIMNSFVPILSLAMYSLLSGSFDLFIPLYSLTSAFVASNPFSSIAVNSPFPASVIDDVLT